MDLTFDLEYVKDLGTIVWSLPLKLNIYFP